MGETLADSGAVGEDVLFTAAKVIALSWYPLLPAQEHSSAGVQPGVCMANMQKARKGSEGTVGPEPGTASHIIFPV